MSLICSGCRLPINKGDDYILWEQGVIGRSPKSGLDVPVPDVEDLLHVRCAAERLTNPNCVLYDEVIDKMGRICQNCYEEIQVLNEEVGVPSVPAPSTAPMFIPPWNQGK